ncbi:hypothetical protein GBN32_00375 [Plesiomonas shigelloides]|uniref:hypothetical protein n=1 Tax=Plesiomonas shigelloides TaxID=703 RepID=UPI0012626DD6|nr:hypothetical protein [Plesiomonas shigelloides]KAB7715727.1 hypothetical protein GBN32_00375 [Plesiomonas shigelloides]
MQTYNPHSNIILNFIEKQNPVTVRLSAIDGISPHEHGRSTTIYLNGSFLVLNIPYLAVQEAFMAAVKLKTKENEFCVIDIKSKTAVIN